MKVCRVTAAYQWQFDSAVLSLHKIHVSELQQWGADTTKVRLFETLWMSSAHLLCTATYLSD